MPSLQQFIQADCQSPENRSNAGTDILYKLSINSLLEQRHDLINRSESALWSTEGERMISLLGLSTNSRDSIFDLHSELMSPVPQYRTLTPSSTQSSMSPGTSSSSAKYQENFNFDNAEKNIVSHSLPNNTSFDSSAPISPSTPTSIYNISFHGSSPQELSNNESCSNLIVERNQNGINSSRSDSPESDESVQSNLEKIYFGDIISLMALNRQQKQKDNQIKTQKFYNNSSLPLQHIFNENVPNQSLIYNNPKQNQEKPNDLHIQNPNCKNSFNNNSLEITPADLQLTKMQACVFKLAQAQQTPIQIQTHNTPESILGISQYLQNCNSQQVKNCETTKDSHLDRVAKFHRSSAAFYDATCTWRGNLPQRSHKIVNYSPKVFLGGIPWDINEQSLMQIFRPFGQIRVEWPGKEHQAAQPKGYVYVVFESEKQVKALLSACILNDDSPSTAGNYYFKISSKRIKAKQVEVIPWIIADSNYVKSASQKLDPTKTVFVGALHGKLTAEGLSNIMNDLFDGVVYAGIDTDKYKYPIGSGRVTFNNNRSYMKAVSAAFIEIKTMKFSKKVQIDPYLEDSLCSICGLQHGPYFCRELFCFRYFCRSCWQWQHSSDSFKDHKPMTRNSKSQQLIGVGPQSVTEVSKTFGQALNSTNQDYFNINADNLFNHRLNSSLTSSIPPQQYLNNDISTNFLQINTLSPSFI